MATHRRVPTRNTALMEAAQQRLTEKLGSFFADTARHVSRQISERIARETIGKAATAKVKRDAFLYLDPRGDKSEFAQCGTCKEFLSDNTCDVFGQQVAAGGSCGLYVPGKADPSWKREGRLVTPEEAGYVERPVRCENCRFFENGECGLFDTLNDALPDVFDLKTVVDAKGCCNAQTPMTEEELIRAIRNHDVGFVKYDLTTPARNFVVKSLEHSAQDLHVIPENAERISGFPIADPVTQANALHVFVNLVRDGQKPIREMVPLNRMIAVQQVVDRQRVAKHEADRDIGQTDGRPPLLLYWDRDFFIFGGHHSLQSAYNLGVDAVEADVLIAPDG